MRQGFIVALAIAVVGVFGCSKNEAASSKCGASADSSACESCCHASGANGYKYTGAGTCSCLGGASAPATASPLGASGSFAGTYKSNWGLTVFAQDGARVTATYSRGSMSCTAAGSALDCTWHEGTTSGKAALVKEANGAIKGTWGNGASATDGGPWLFSP